MKESIRQRAHALGFDQCRFTTAEPPATAPAFLQWLERGEHGQMGYLQRNAHKRVDPQQVLPGSQTIVTLAASYTPEEAPHSTPDTAPSFPGTVARYARYSDYHHLLAPPLHKLTDFVNAFGDTQSRSLWYIDTGPILERDLAQRAGLGFIGKHTNLISRKLGNWFFLAEILTTVPVEPDPPERNHCGSCTRCITACPTNAIPAPFQLDARRCISYLTIELKGSIPTELRPLIGDRIYGCDDCLAACPWNRFAQQANLMQPAARSDLARPDLLELLRLDETEFKRRFAGTPMLRTKRRGLLRNVCVALGNTADHTALPALQKAAQDPEPLIAEHATWAITEIQRRHPFHRPNT